MKLVQLSELTSLKAKNKPETILLLYWYYTTITLLALLHTYNLCRTVTSEHGRPKDCWAGAMRLVQGAQQPRTLHSSFVLYFPLFGYDVVVLNIPYSPHHL